MSKRQASGSGTATRAKRVKDQHAESRDFRPLSRNVCLLPQAPHFVLLPRVKSEEIGRVLKMSDAKWEELADASSRCKKSKDRKSHLEAAARLMKNREAVLRDMTLEANPAGAGLVQPKQTQPELQRVLPQDAQAADEMMREVARRLLGTTEVRPLAPKSAAARKVWRVGSAYLHERVQTETMDAYRREPDMSCEAANALRSVLTEVGCL